MKGVVAAIAAGLLGCTEAPPPVVCDGSSELRVAVQTFAGGPVESGEELLWQNGGRFFFLDGQCRYHVRWGDSLRSDVKSGVLADPDELARGLQLATVEEREGGYAGEWLDGGGERISFDGHAVSCGAGCEGGNVPGWLEDVSDFADEHLAALDAGSEAPDLPQRIVLIDQVGQVGYGSWPWPAAVDPSTLAVDESEASAAGAAGGILVEGADGDALRELRRFVRDGGSPSIYIAPTQDQQPPDYRLYLRDAIPWEDERGIVPVQPASSSDSAQAEISSKLSTMREW